ncbi:MAG: copper resistance protein B [Candidatus Krumholzibacteriia bacterium]
MPRVDGRLLALTVATVLFTGPVLAQDQPETPTTAERPRHQDSARQADGDAPAPSMSPLLPDGMTLDEVLDLAAAPPPAHFPDPVPDDQIYRFTLVEQLAYRFGSGESRDHLGWEAQGWLGGDFNRFWWKTEGEAVFEGQDAGETETDLLYARLVTPFWNLQFGVQYANEWRAGDYDDRWSGVVGVQGMAPFLFELDTSLYVSTDADVTLALEVEYDLRLTQRLVLQPRTELGLAAQDIPERELGAGPTDIALDLRLRHEIKREFAPYVGLSYRLLLGETGNIAEAEGRDTSELYYLAGLRFAF